MVFGECSMARRRSVGRGDRQLGFFTYGEWSPESVRYFRQWREFVSWAGRSDRTPLPADPEDVAAYLDDLGGTERSVPALWAAQKAIFGRHMDLGLDDPCEHDLVRTTLERLEESRTRVSGMSARPLRLEHYLAIRKVAHEPRVGRGGRMESEDRVLRRGTVDEAMIGLMREARLGARAAADLKWRDVVRVSDGTGRVCVSGPEGEELRVISADTLRMISSIRRCPKDCAKVIGLSRNRIAIRIGEAAEQAGLGKGFRGDGPRQGMMLDLEELGVDLLAEQLDTRLGRYQNVESD